LYRRETWSLTLNEEHRLRVTEKRLLRRVNLRGRRGREAREDCIMRIFITCKLHEILLGEMKMNTKFVGKPEGKRPLGRLRRKWEDIRRDLTEIGCEGVDWMHLAQDSYTCWALVNTAMNL